MKKAEPDKIRNMALIGHASAGKTSLAEAILFCAGTIDRMGRVDDGTSNMDFEPEETRRHITLSTSFSFAAWNGYHINIIDTPGSSNFLADTYTCLRTADTVVLVTEAVGGLKVQAEKIWRKVKEYALPAAMFVTKMDKERADFENTIEEAKNTLGVNLVAASLPVGSEDKFKGVVDLLKMKALIWEQDGSGKFTETEIPQDLKEKAEAWRTKLIEAVAESSDELLESYLEGKPLTHDEIKAGFRKAVVSGSIIPVLCGSGSKNIGMQTVLDLATSSFPAPLEREPAKGVIPGKNEEVLRKPDEQSHFSAQILKTVAAFAGNLSIFRVLSGKLNADSTVYNSTRGARERIGQIFVLDGKKLIPLGAAGAGDIVTVQKLKDTRTGDTLCDEKNQVLYPPLPLLPAIMTFAIQPKSRGDEEKIANALHKLQEEDPNLRVHRDAQTKEMLLSGVGQMHIEVVVEKMKRKFQVDVDLREPKVPYKETVKRSAKSQGKYKRQSGGRGQYGDTWLEVDPLPRGSGFQFVDKIVGGAIPKNYIPAVEKGVVEAMEEGVIAGCPVVDIKVTLYDGSYHDVDSSDMAFKIAASMGFKKAFGEASPVLLEPVMSMEVSVPDDCMGDVNGDITRRRGRVVGIESKGGYQVIKANVPMAEVLKYAPDLKSMTSDRGDFTMEFSHYEEVPAHLVEKVVAAKQKELS